MSEIPRKAHLLRLVPYLSKYKKHFVLGTAMVLLTNVAAVVSPWILRNAIDHLHRELSREVLLYYVFLMVAISLVEGVFRFLMRRIMIGVSRNIEYDLRNDLFTHLESLSPSFYKLNPTGDLMSKATNDLSAVRMVLGPGIMYTLNTVFTAILTMAILITLSPVLAILTLIPLLAVSYSVKYFGEKIHKRFEKIQEQFSRLTTLAQENVSGMRVVKAYHQEKAFGDRFRQANDEYVLKALSLVQVWGIFNPLLTFLLGLSSVALLWYGGHQVVQGEISVGDFVAFMAYVTMLTWPTIALGWVINIFERGAASMGRMNQIFESTPEIQDQNPRPISQLEGRIRVQGLDFSYNGISVLRDLSFAVSPGETLAIVGKTGSGKSTLANLICRLYRVPRGAILIDNTDINDIPLYALRRNIGYVPQDTFLFSESIQQNIAFGNPDSDSKAIEKYSRISNIWPDIQSFPDKFETFVGERGITLSGGQKQRIAISRALLVDPRILILDDALSSVDTHTEEEIQQELAEALTDRTVILISHRVSTVKMADHILVLDEGRIVEQGTHAELLQAEGQYASLYQKQLLREELEIE